MPELSKIRNTQTGVDYDIVDAQARLTKAPINNPSFTGTPTIGTSTIATVDLVELRNVYHVTGIIPQGSGKTFTTNSNSTYRINSNMRVINCVFGTPSNVTSIVSWSTATDAIQFSGTFSGQTNIDFDLVETKTMTIS